MACSVTSFEFRHQDLENCAKNKFLTRPIASFGYNQPGASRISAHPGEGSTSHQPLLSGLSSTHAEKGRGEGCFESSGFRLRAPAAARPARCPLFKAAAVALFHQVVDAVVYGYLAVAWMHSLGSVAVEILGRWTYGYGEGSAEEAIGPAVRAACWCIMVRLFPAFFPLLLMRLHQRVVFEHQERGEEGEGGDEGDGIDSNCP